jgi:predicted dehydrogenase
MAGELRVGIIGANARGGWAGEAHVPAVQGMDGLTLAAVAANSRETADEAAHAFAVGKSYADGATLIADPDIDVVTVATRVPDHGALVRAAAAAGKHVYCEWPLGAGSAESAVLARSVMATGVHGVIGLQLRGSPAVAAARDRLAAGAIGRLLAVRAVSTTAGFGPDVAAPYAYLEDPASFANLVTIQGAHTLDLVLALAGPTRSVSALLSRQFPEIRVGEDRAPRRRKTYDHLAAHGRLVGDVPFTIEVRGADTGTTPFRLDLIGERGTISLDGGAPRGLQSGRIGLLIDGERTAVNEGPVANLPDAAANVAGLYAQLRDDVRDGCRKAPDFRHATHLAGLIETLFAANDDGHRHAVEDEDPIG